MPVELAFTFAGLLVSSLPGTGNETTYKQKKKPPITVGFFYLSKSAFAMIVIV